jgi:3',5'-cyclic AMP phosphodiesterase CpdA
MWETTDHVPSKLRYKGTGNPSWIEVGDTHTDTIHDIHINGLLTGTVYDYQVSQDGYDTWLSLTGTFTTAPSSTSSFRASVYGDSRSFPEDHRAVVDAVLLDGPDLVLHTGDFVYDGDVKSQWIDQFFSPAADLLLNTPLFPAIGNHDLAAPASFWYSSYIQTPGDELWYAFTYGCARFISLDTNSPSGYAPGSEQYDWLVTEMGSQPFEDSEWQVVFFHHPPYTSGKHGPDLDVQASLVPMFEANDVDLVFSGHNHNYERSYKDGVYYIVTGGGGAPLYGFPNQDLNPYSQVRVSEYHFVSLDFSCDQGHLEFNVRDTENVRIDGPLLILGDSFNRVFLPVINRE